MPEIEDFYGKKIQYKGVAFEGSPSTVFWNFIEPFLESLMGWGFDIALAHGRQRELDLRGCLVEARQALSEGIHEVYRRMQDIDRGLRWHSKGLPKDVPPAHDISEPIRAMHAKLTEYFESAQSSA
jgi:hypothetical protein